MERLDTNVSIHPSTFFEILLREENVPLTLHGFKKTIVLLH